MKNKVTITVQTTEEREITLPYCYITKGGAYVKFYEEGKSINIYSKVIELAEDSIHDSIDEMREECTIDEFNKMLENSFAKFKQC